MGQRMSCVGSRHDRDFFTAVRAGDLEKVSRAVEEDPSLLLRTTVYDRLSALHIASANGHVEILSMILQKSVSPDFVNRHKQTPLMLAAIHGQIACLQKLLEAGANILIFDSLNGRTCLHYAAYHGHSDCLRVILSAAQSTVVADSWGFARFVNVGDVSGATPLHLAARRRRPECVHILLDSGALVCASTGGYGHPGSSPLHLAARGGSLDCIRELLAWGADRLQRDSSGRIPYSIAIKRNYGACAALLNPSAAEPLVWPSPLKFISELDPDAKALLEAALIEANKEREKKIFNETKYLLSSLAISDEAVDDDDASMASDTELCSICFSQVCNIEVQDCGHQMCAHCTLALCCHSKPNPTTLCIPSPTCPFCRSSIARLVVAKVKAVEEGDKGTNSKLRTSRRSRNISGGSGSFKGLSLSMGSFSRMGRGSGRIMDNEDMEDKPI